MLFFLIRHGDPDYEHDSLTPAGVKQAEAIAERLAVYGIDEIYTSSLGRAVATAEPACRKMGLTPRLCDWAKEDDVWRTMTVPDGRGGRTWPFYSAEYNRLFNRPDVLALGRRWAESPLFSEMPFRRGAEEMQKEADAFFLSLGYRHDAENGLYVPEDHNGRRIALFAHQGFGLLFLSCVLDVPYPLFCTHFDIGHSGMTVVDFTPNGEGFVIPKVLQLSNDGHLYKEGLPTLYQNVIPI